MISSKERSTWALAILAAAAWVVYPFATSWQPYDDIEIVALAPNDDGAVFVADFIKLECEFDKFFVFGLTSGVPINLRYTDVEPQFTDQDRPAGQQRLSIQIYTEGRLFDGFEFRTRHLCDGEKVDKVFATVEVPE